MCLITFGIYPVLILVVVFRLKYSVTRLFRCQPKRQNGTQFIRTSAPNVEQELENTKVPSGLVLLLPT